MANLKCYTLSYDPMGDGFDTGLLDTELAGSEVTVEHAELFSYDGLPRLNLVLQVQPRERPIRRPAVDYRAKLRDSEQPLYDALRVWRRRQAVSRAIPPYLVVSNRALAGIASTRPETVEAMLEVPGVGEITAKRYGDELLEVVRAAAA